MHNVWMSEEIVSGTKPSASMARAVCQPNEPFPWPTSKMTPRCRAACTAVLILPLPSIGAFGKRRKQWVSTYPTQPRDNLLVRGRRLVDVHHQRRPISFGHLLATSSGTIPAAPLAVRPMRTLMPVMRSAVGLDHVDAVPRGEQSNVVSLSHHDAL